MDWTNLPSILSKQTNRICSCRCSELAAAGTSQEFVAKFYSACIFKVHLQSLSAAEIFFHLSSLIQAQLLIRQ